MEYTRINKPTARKMFREGYTIYLIPCKVSEHLLQIPKDNLGWLKPTEISLSTTGHDANHFDRTVNEFEYYNCNAELGYYAHYYVTRGDFEKYELSLSEARIRKELEGLKCKSQSKNPA